MLILPDYNRPYIIESLTSPIVVKYNWMFSAPLCDFVLKPIHYLEETTGPAVRARINNFDFWVPASWYILVTDLDTYQLDLVPISSCAQVKHQALAFVVDELRPRVLDVTVLDYRAEPTPVIHPMIGKGLALVHPVGPSLDAKRVQLSVVIGPHDLYRYLSGKMVGDLYA